MRIIGHVSENNRSNFQAVWNRIIGKKLSIITSGLAGSYDNTFTCMASVYKHMETENRYNCSMFCTRCGEGFKKKSQKSHKNQL